MKDIDSLRQRRGEIIREIASLDQMRRGSVVEQYVEVVRKDGSKARRGPYPLYSFKEKKKTVSRRLKDRAQAELFRGQIQAFRRFQELTAELVEIGERLSDLAVSGKADVKKTPISRSKRTPR